jgi:hypothetical protein
MLAIYGIVLDLGVGCACECGWCEYRKHLKPYFKTSEPAPAFRYGQPTCNAINRSLHYESDGQSMVEVLVTIYAQLYVPHMRPRGRGFENTIL